MQVRSRGNKSVIELRKKQAALKSAINHTVDQYERDLSALRRKYETQLMMMVDDYRDIKAAIECAECPDADICPNKVTFRGFTTRN